MTQHYTTMNAPLTPEEYSEMERALGYVRGMVSEIPADLSPSDLLRVATLVIDYGFKLRDTINKNLAAANRRHGQDRRVVNHLRVVPKGVTVLRLDEISMEELDDAVRSVTGEPKK